MLENDRINYMNFLYIEGNQIGGFYEYLTKYHRCLASIYLEQ